MLDSLAIRKTPRRRFRTCRKLQLVIPLYSQMVCPCIIRQWNLVLQRIPGGRQLWVTCLKCRQAWPRLHHQHRLGCIRMETTRNMPVRMDSKERIAAMEARRDRRRRARREGMAGIRRCRMTSGPGSGRITIRRSNGGGEETSTKVSTNLDALYPMARARKPRARSCRALCSISII